MSAADGIVVSLIEVDDIPPSWKCPSVIPHGYHYLNLKSSLTLFLTLTLTLNRYY